MRIARLVSRFSRIRLFFFLAMLVLVAGCKTNSGHFLAPDGRPLRDLDYLWEEVDTVFPGALPDKVTFQLVDGPHAVFMIESNSIGIPAMFKPEIRRGKICRTLTHLALHSLSGGDKDSPGRCFDNDVVFLRQAIAGYMDRKATGFLQDEVEAASLQAATMFRESKLSSLALRDWESFFYRGYWADQYREWNIDGIEALLSLGEYLERSYGLSAFALVFAQLGKGGSLDKVMKKVLGMNVDALVSAWREDVFSRYPEKDRLQEEEPRVDTDEHG